MKMLMKNNAMKFVMCAGMFCGTNFGMEKETTMRRIPLNNDNHKKQERRLSEQQVRDLARREDQSLVCCLCLSSLAYMVGIPILAAANANNSTGK
jgi:hypothetical protein